MKKIIGYRKVMGVNENATLQELKSAYRNLMKEWHPDKFPDDAESKALIEGKSRHIIEAYHFLVSIAPETREKGLAEFTTTTTTVGVADMDYKNETVQITYLNGNVYEWFGVPKALYIKLLNAPALARFARRHIYDAFPYRAVSKAEAEVEN